MTLKIGSWMIAIGCFVAAAGLLHSAGSVRRAARYRPDSRAAAMLFSMGMVLAASGFYMKARYLAGSRTLEGSVRQRPAKRLRRLRP